jgi:thiol-disulfide isomerase/thioredoxin
MICISTPARFRNCRIGLGPFGGTGILACVVFALLSQSLFAATLPRKSSEFTIQMPDGKQLLLSSYKGKPVVLAFILTTCSHCQAFTRLLTKAQTDYGPRGLQVVESAIEENAKAAVPGFIRAFQPPFPVGYNAQVAAADFLEHPRQRIMSMPAVMFIDRQGTIVAQYTSSDEFMQEGVWEKNLRAKIEELLSGGASTAKKTPAKKAATPAKKQ